MISAAWLIQFVRGFRDMNTESPGHSQHKARSGENLRRVPKIQSFLCSPRNGRVSRRFIPGRGQATQSTPFFTCVQPGNVDLTARLPNRGQPPLHHVAGMQHCALLETWRVGTGVVTFKFWEFYC